MPPSSTLLLFFTLFLHCAFSNFLQIQEYEEPKCKDAETDPNMYYNFIDICRREDDVYGKVLLKGDTHVEFVFMCTDKACSKNCVTQTQPLDTCVSANDGDRTVKFTLVNKIPQMDNVTYVLNYNENLENCTHKPTDFTLVEVWTGCDDEGCFDDGEGMRLFSCKVPPFLNKF